MIGKSRIKRTKRGATLDEVGDRHIRKGGSYLKRDEKSHIGAR